MKKVTVGNHVLEFEEDFIKNYEMVTCGDFSECIEDFILSGFLEEDIDTVFNKYSVQEIRNKVFDFLRADILLYTK